MSIAIREQVRVAPDHSGHVSNPLLEPGAKAEVMIESLDTAPLTEVDQAWIDLAQRRADEIRAGTARTHSAEDVLN